MKKSTKRKKIKTDIICNQNDCMYNQTELGICIFLNPDLWLWKTNEEIDWKCNSYEFNPIYGLNEEELKNYRILRVYEKTH